MSEQLPSSGIEFGVASATTLVEKAQLSIIDELELYKVAQEQQYDWLHDYYNQEIFPGFHRAWRFAAENFLKYPTLSEITSGYAERWFTGYIPLKSKVDDSSQWQRGVLSVRAVVNTKSSDPLVGIAREKLAAFNKAYKMGQIDDDNATRSLVNSVFLDANPSLIIELYDEASDSSDGNKDYYFIAEGFIQSRAPATVYTEPFRLTNKIRIRDDEGLFRKPDTGEIMNVCTNSFATTEILGEYGLVLAGGSQLLDTVVRIPSDSSMHSPNFSRDKS